MTDFRRGFREVAIGIIASVTITAVLRGSAQDGLIPSYMVFLLTFCGLLGAILLMMSFVTSGIIFTIGWIVGAIMLRDMLSAFDSVVYLVAPIVALVARGVVHLYSRNFNG